MGFEFDNKKQRKTASKLLKRLTKGHLNGRQAIHFMMNHSSFKDDRSYDFLDHLIKSSEFPIRKKGDKIFRTDISREA